MPKVSVIIPCYNHGKYIDEAVDSILNQTFKDFEIIIVNDGSTDELTNNKLKQYDKPKTFVINKENEGLSVARNTAIKRAVGEYILTLDADDSFEPSFLSKAVYVLDNKPEIGIVTCGVRAYGYRYFEWYPSGGTIKEALLGHPASGNSLYRKKCWEQAGEYNSNMDTAYEDWDFYIGVTKHGWHIHTINELLFNYRKLKDSMSATGESDRLRLYRQIINNHIDVYKENLCDVLVGKEKELIRETKFKRYFGVLLTKNKWLYLITKRIYTFLNNSFLKD